MSALSAVIGVVVVVVIEARGRRSDCSSANSRRNAGTPVAVAIDAAATGDSAAAISAAIIGDTAAAMDAGGARRRPDTPRLLWRCMPHLGCLRQQWQRRGGTTWIGKT